MQKTILVIYTGGTIGMDYGTSGLTVVPGLFSRCLASLEPVADVKLDLIEYEQLIDSSDITIQVWIKIITDIIDNYDKYDGFVLIHGTDTMAYTSSILAFALMGLSKPVILTGAQLPLAHRRSDGWSNLTEAIYAAAQSDLKEVAIAFNHRLFRGCRAQKISTNRFLGFDSVDDEPLAEFGIHVEWYRHRLFKSLLAFAPVVPNSEIKVINLTLSPGYTINHIINTLNNDTLIQGIVLQTYGSGTIPMHDQRLTVALKNACDRGVVIVSVTQVIEGRISNQYINSRLSNLGVINGYDMTPEAAIAKLTILLSMNLPIAVVKEQMTENLVGELTKDHKV